MAIVSSAQDDFFVKAILGEEYVQMTQENIANGDPFGVYRDEDKFTMFIRIAFNNIQVAFKTFATGIFFGIGSLYILFNNGLLVGSFEYMFFAQGLGWKSIMVIWIHGTIEISSIIIAGAAGLIVGSSILFPGTYSRYQSFRRGIKDAMKIVLALIPFLLLAALLESYVTYLMSNTFSTQKNAGMPLWAGIGILAISVALIVWYFVWYPIQVAKKQAAQLIDEQAKTPTLAWPE
jgi:uncharacterized membrane protein SpoIIM required for sporulation